jgi:hypothetical protein
LRLGSVSLIICQSNGDPANDDDEAEDYGQPCENKFCGRCHASPRRRRLAFTIKIRFACRGLFRGLGRRSVVRLRRRDAEYVEAVATLDAFERNSRSLLVGGDVELSATAGTVDAGHGAASAHSRQRGMSQECKGRYG